jgi:hypothetical protein
MAEEAEFEQFGEAARLYADYAAVVEQVHRAFLTDVNAFLDALRERVGSLVSVPVQENRDDKKSVRRWWLSEGEDSLYPEHLYIWVKTNAVKIVRPGVLDVSPWTWPVFKPFRHQIVAVKDTLSLPPTCKVKKGIDGSPFTLTISYGEQDPVGEAAAPIAELLAKLYEVERQVPAVKPQ